MAKADRNAGRSTDRKPEARSDQVLTSLRSPSIFAPPPIVISSSARALDRQRDSTALEVSQIVHTPGYGTHQCDRHERWHDGASTSDVEQAKWRAQRGAAEEGNDEGDVDGADKEEEDDDEVTSKHDQHIYKGLTDVFNSQHDPYDPSMSTSQLQIEPIASAYVCFCLLTFVYLTYYPVLGLLTLLRALMTRQPDYYAA